MLEPRELELIESFLTKVGKADLFEYYKLAAQAPSERLDRAVRKRRQWAQGQQSNPKFRDEALWLIKNNKLVRRTLLEEREAYLEALTTRVDARSLETLALFVKGTLAAGVLTPDGEAAIHKQGEALGLDQEKVRTCIEEQLEETGTGRGASPAALPTGDPWEDDLTELAGFVDHYAILEIEQVASLEEIERAHRTRYRWARSLSDKKRASEIYAQLDEAWRILKDDDRRAAFDAIYRLRNPTEDEDDVFGDLLSGSFEPVNPVLGPLKLTTEDTPPAPPDLGADVTGSLGSGLHSTLPQHTTEDVQPRPLSLSGSSSGSHGRVQPSPSGAPEPPPVVSRTVGLGPTKTRRRTPRLAVVGPDIVELKVSRSPVHHLLTVKNAGGGRMRGRATSNKEWLEVSPTRLDPDAVEQAIDVVVHPKLMPRNESVGLVILTAAHGDRETVTFRVHRHRVTSTEMGLFAVLAILVLSVAHSMGWLLALAGLVQPAPEEVIEPATLEVRCDPPADAIFVDGRAVGSGERALVESGLPLGQGINVTVTLAGFHEVKERLTLQAGEEKVLEVVLELSDTMDWEPEEDSAVVDIDPEAVRSALAARGSELAACLTAAQAAGAKEPATLETRLFITGIGRVRGLETGSRSNLSGDPLPCLKRQLRVLELPLLQGDYATFSHTFTAGSGGAE